MQAEGLFEQAAVYLGAAVVAVPIAKRLGLGSVLGYLLAGIAIGPFALGLVGEEGQDVMHFAEFGVVMMLFLIGLELQPSRLWRMRMPILGTGGLQVGITAAAITGLAVLLGLRWQMGLAVGMTLALSSTAIVLQSLSEKRLMTTDAGQRAFSVLLFQDIAVIPMLALFPLLATEDAADSATSHGEVAAYATTWVEGLPPWEQTLVVLAAVAAIVVAGRYAMRPVFRVVARTRLPELFTATSLLLILGTALLMTKVGLSPALGAFVAGVVLANSEYRHELESDLAPFKGLLLAVFFIAVGASIDFRRVGEDPLLIAGLVVALIALKLLVLLILGRAFRMGADQNLLFSFSLAQGGEFAFVLFSYATQHGVLPDEITAPLTAVVAITMALTPVLLLFDERVLQPHTGTRERVKRAPDEVHEASPVIIAGFGRFGSIVGRFLRANGIHPTVLDYDSDHVDVLRKLGHEVYYGDASRLDLLRAAGAANAKLLVIALDDQQATVSLVDTVRKHFPSLAVLARASGRLEAYELLDHGVEHIYRETLDTSLRLGVDALRLLGRRGHASHRAALKFRRHDEEAVRELGRLRHDRAAYVTQAKERMRWLEQLLVSEVEDPGIERDSGWDAESLREEYAERSAGI